MSSCYQPLPAPLSVFHPHVPVLVHRLQHRSPVIERRVNFDPCTFHEAAIRRTEGVHGVADILVERFGRAAREKILAVHIVSDFDPARAAAPLASSPAGVNQVPTSPKSVAIRAGATSFPFACNRKASSIHATARDIFRPSTSESPRIG